MRSAAEYICPMHPEIVQDHSGNCPICGMALEPKNVETKAMILNIKICALGLVWISISIPVFSSRYG